jgi:hypothetical protein
MTAITFDTLKYTKILEDAGVPRNQAEAQARAQREVFSETIEQIETNQHSAATKQDLIAHKAEMNVALAELKADLIKWMFGGFVAVIGLLVAIILKLN